MRGETAAAIAAQRSGKAVYEQVYALFSWAGCDVTRFAQSRRSKQTPGVPDLYVRHVELGKRLWFECKAGTGRPSRAQRDWHERERACGGEVVVGGYDEAVEVLVSWGLIERHGRLDLRVVRHGERSSG